MTNDEAVMLMLVIEGEGGDFRLGEKILFAFQKPSANYLTRWLNILQQY